jgi:hypothetical protein
LKKVTVVQIIFVPYGDDNIITVRNSAVSHIRICWRVTEGHDKKGRERRTFSDDANQLVASENV